MKASFALIRKSLKVKIILLVLVIFFAGLWSLVFHVRDKVITDTRRLLGEQHFSTVSIVAAGVSHALQGRITSLYDVSLLPEDVRLEHAGSVQTYLEQRRTLVSRFNAGTFVARADGEIIAAVPRSRAGLIGSNVLKSPHISRALRENTAQIGPLVTNPSDGKTEVEIVMPIHDAQGYVSGALVGIMTLRCLNFIVGSGEPVQVGNLLLIDPTQRTSASAEDASGAMLPLPGPGENAAVDRLIAGFEGAEVMNFPDTTPSLVAAKRLMRTGWVIVSSMPMKDAFLPVYDIDHRILLDTLVLTLLIGGLTYWILRNQLAPLARATRTLAQRSEEEIVAVPLEIERDDEVGQLIAGFNRVQDQLVQSESRFRQMMNSSYAAIFLMDENRIITYANPRMAEMFGIPLGQMIGTSYFSLIDPSQLDESRMRTTKALLAGQDFHTTHERLCVRADGSRFWAHLTGRVFFNAKGEQTGLLTVMLDVSETKRLEQRLALAASVFEHAQEGILIADAAGTIVEVNHSFQRITGYGQNEVIGRNPRLLQSGRHDSAFYQDMWRHLQENGHWFGEIWNRRKDGATYPSALTISAVHDAAGKVSHYVSVFSDISAIKDQERQIEILAHYDVLTGLPNRLLLADRMSQAMISANRTGRLMAVICIDIDDFKRINDRYGLEVGDRFLVVLAERFQNALHESDTIARISGDEFVIVHSGLTEAAHCIPTLKRLLEAASQPCELVGQRLQVSASIGVTFYPQSGKTNDEQLLRQADQALYQAKLGGKNAFHFFDSGQDQTLRDYYENQERIRQALEKREFVLYYQPKVNMRTGTIVGAEALIRWRHPERGILPPIAFLPYTENHPLSVEIGAWVMDEALSQMDRWRKMGVHLPVSVNLSATELEHPDFLTHLYRILEKHPDVAPQDFELEVLESSALKDLDNVCGIIDTCRQAGLKIALDDFGTGYSSLTYLRRLSVDRLKIDQSFVREMLVNPDDFIILEGVINMSQAFRREAIAEGVETVEHGVLLLQLGCEYAQGYGIARPMPADAIPDWIKGWKPFPEWLGREPVSNRFFPVLLASIEHRAWLKTLTNALENAPSSPPALDTKKCRFGAWIENESREFPDLQNKCLQIGKIHQQAHEMADQLCDLYAQGKNGEQRQRLAESLSSTSANLLEELTTLIDMSGNYEER